MFKFIALAFATSILMHSASANTDAQGEIVYLVNCGDHNDYSTMVYYKDWTKSQHAEEPDAIARVCSTFGAVHWEGFALSTRFADGNIFTSNIRNGANNLSNGDVAGDGLNNYRQFTCYKDNKRLLYLDPNGYNCYSIYYCD
jgi:hypothetical protein